MGRAAVLSEHPETNGAFKKICIAFWKDLKLLASLNIARFIVWRALRREHREKNGPRE